MKLLLKYTKKIKKLFQNLKKFQHFKKLLMKFLHNLTTREKI